RRAPPGDSATPAPGRGGARVTALSGGLRGRPDRGIVAAMDAARRVRISKFLALHLRHDPARLGLELEPGGWVAVEALLAACARRGRPITRAQLEEVVRTSDKQRFAFDAEGRKIRANQGHSVEVDLQLEVTAPPDVLFHGTGERAVAAILREGLLKMRRHHVHLSGDAATAQR